MAPFKYPHPGHVIQRELSFLKVDLTDAAKTLGITAEVLNNIIDAGAPVTMEIAVNLESAYHISAATIMKWQREYDRQQSEPNASDDGAINGWTDSLPLSNTGR